MWQKCILLAFVETVNFINKKNSAATCIAILPGALDRLANFFLARGDGSNTLDISVRIAGNHFSEGCFAGTRWPPEDHRM